MNNKVYIYLIWRYILEEEEISPSGFILAPNTIFWDKEKQNWSIYTNVEKLEQADRYHVRHSEHA
jgi:hypothetical protein